MVSQCEISAWKVLSIDYSVDAPRILRMTKRCEPLRFGRVGVGQRPRVNSLAVQDDGRGEAITPQRSFFRLNGKQHESRVTYRTDKHRSALEYSTARKGLFIMTAGIQRRPRIPMKSTHPLIHDTRRSKYVGLTAHGHWLVKHTLAGPILDPEQWSI
jgi:hypothetical protein